MERASEPLLRAAGVIIVSSWVALTLGILVSATESDRDFGLVLGAAATSGAFVALITYFPRQRLIVPGLVLELTIVGGSVLTVASTTLTGGLDSPYLLIALIPTLLASMAGGLRYGLTAALLSAGMLTGVVILSVGANSLAAGLGNIALFPLLAVVVAQIRGLLVDIEARADELERASIQAEAELNRLSQANELLRRLTDVYAKGSANPVDVGRSAVDAVVDFLPGSFATATLFDSQGPVVVARSGTDAPDHARYRFPLDDGNTTSGVLSLGTPQALSSEQRTEIERILRPVAVSFVNAILLQEIASEAVREERLRLARELHDEVGPALAALGFALDAVTLQIQDLDISEDVAGVREGFGMVVEDMRGIISDLRADEPSSLTAALTRSVTQFDGSTSIEIEVHERRPPRSSTARHLLAVITEALRNALRHADATLIRVSGTVDRDRVEIEVTDDGTGFDTQRVPEGHFGLMGMNERVDRIGATLDIRSSEEGTIVRVFWKEDR